MRVPCFPELSPNLERRIQRRQRTLQDQRNRPSPQRAQFALREQQQVGTLKPDRAFRFYVLLIEQPQNRHGQSALAGTALPNESEDLALLNFDFQLTQDGLLFPISYGDASGKQSLVRWGF